MPQQGRPRNLFATGLEALLDSFANQDVARRRAAEEAAAAEQTRLVNERQERALKIQEDTANERREAAKAQAAEKAAAKAEETRAAEELDMLMVEYHNATDARQKSLLGARILNRGGKLPAPPAARLRPVVIDGIAYDPETGQKLFGSSLSGARRAGAAKEDPKVPDAVKRWMESKSTGGESLEEARRQLSQHWATTKKFHPKADLAAVSKYLNDLYAKDPADPYGDPSPLGTAPAASPAGPGGPPSAAPMTVFPAGPMSVAPRGGGFPEGAENLPAVGTQPRPERLGPHNVTDEMAITKLQSLGKVVTPETIALAKKLIAEGK